MLRQIDRKGIVAWSPVPNRPTLMAVGRMSGFLGDDPTDTSGALEIFDVPLSHSKDMALLSKATTSDKFHKLSWNPMSNDQYPLGLIASAMESGSITIYDPKTLIEGGDQPLVCTNEKHSGGAISLDFNLNCMASGGANGDIFVWDLTNVSAPKLYHTPQQADGNGVTCVKWNKKAVYILASTSTDGLYSIYVAGRSTVHDLRAKRAVLQLCDPNKQITSRAIAWSPDEATTLLEASESDIVPVLQLWDLRKIHMPYKVLKGHSKGVLSVSWSTLDKSLLLSCARDNSTYCWNLEKGKPVLEVEESPNHDVQWSPHIPSFLSTCSYEGKVKVFSTESAVMDE